MVVEEDLGVGSWELGAVGEGLIEKMINAA